MKTYVIILSLLSLCACNTVKQSATTRTTDPKTGIVDERTVESSVKTRGDAKAYIEKMNGGATSKSAHIGASGVSEESNVTDLIKAIGEAAAKLLDQVIQSSAAAGAKAVKP